MRVAVLSDIHANLEALQAVLRSLLEYPADSVITLGDVIGYGPDPEAVVHLLQEKNIPSVQGNHEQALISGRKLGWFNSPARRSINITRKLLSPRTLDMIGNWPMVIENDSFLAVHGCPPDDAFTYLFEYAEDELPELFQQFTQPVCFVGHTHMLHVAIYDGRRATLRESRPGQVALNPLQRHIINPGSVGQPRDGTNTAKYAVWDTRQSLLEFRAVPYDVETTIAKVQALGFPELNVRRLRG